VLALRVGEADEAARLVTGDERHHDRGFLVYRTRDRITPVLRRNLVHLLVDDECFACSEHVRGESPLFELCRADRHPLAVFEQIRVVDKPRLRVVDSDAHVGLVEDLADLVADRVVDPLHVELGGERLLHAGDDRELGRALLLGLEQALGLVEQARVFERDRHRVGQRGEEAHVGVDECILRLAVERGPRPAASSPFRIGTPA
jgi:hypothetical protein